MRGRGGAEVPVNVVAGGWALGASRCASGIRLAPREPFSSALDCGFRTSDRRRSRSVHSSRILHVSSRVTSRLAHLRRVLPGLAGHGLGHEPAKSARRQPGQAARCREAEVGKIPPSCRCEKFLKGLSPTCSHVVRTRACPRVARGVAPLARARPRGGGGAARTRHKRCRIRNVRHPSTRCSMHVTPAQTASCLLHKFVRRRRANFLSRGCEGGQPTYDSPRRIRT